MLGANKCYKKNALIKDKRKKKNIGRVVTPNLFLYLKE